MTNSNTRSGSNVVKFDEATEKALAVQAALMGKKRISKNGQERLVDHTKADAIVALVKETLAARNSEPEQLPLFSEMDGSDVTT